MAKTPFGAGDARRADATRYSTLVVIDRSEPRTGDYLSALSIAFLFFSQALRSGATASATEAAAVSNT